MYKLDDLNLKAKCEKGFEFEVVDENEKPMGVFLTVIGASAETIRRASFAAHDRNERIKAQKKKRNREDEIQPIEEWADENMELTALRVIAWRGIEEPFNKENVIRLLKSNDLILKQVVAESENISNFTRSKSTS